MSTYVDLGQQVDAITSKRPIWDDIERKSNETRLRLEMELDSDEEEFL